MSREEIYLLCSRAASPYALCNVHGNAKILEMYLCLFQSVPPNDPLYQATRIMETFRSSGVQVAVNPLTSTHYLPATAYDAEIGASDAKDEWNDKLQTLELDDFIGSADYKALCNSVGSKVADNCETCGKKIWKVENKRIIVKGNAPRLNCTECYNRRIVRYQFPY